MVRLRLVLAFWGLAALAAGLAHAEAREDAVMGDATAPRAAPCGDAGPDADTTVAAGVPMVDIAKQDATGARYGLGVRARWVSVPSWLLGLFLKESMPISWDAVGLEGVRRLGDFDIVLGVCWQSLSPPDCNWLGKGKN